MGKGVNTQVHGFRLTINMYNDEVSDVRVYMHELYIAPVAIHIICTVTHH